MDNFVLIRAGEMPQEPFGAFRINERRKRTNVCTPKGVQLDHMMPVINASLKICPADVYSFQKVSGDHASDRLCQGSRCHNSSH